MKIKSQSVWWILLAALLMTVGIFLFAPLGLVGFYVSSIAPNGSTWIGGFYSLGLSLAILTMSGLSFMKGMLRFKIGLGALAVAEGAISFAAFWQKAGEAGLVDPISILGLVGIVAIQETVIFLCGSGVFATINQIRNPLAGSTPSGLPKVREQVTEQKPKPKRGEAKQRILAEHTANPLLTVTELAEQTGTSKAHVSVVLAELRTKPKPLGFSPVGEQEAPHR